MGDADVMNSLPERIMACSGGASEQAARAWLRRFEHLSMVMEPCAVVDARANASPATVR